MDIALWVIQGLLALVYLFAGFTKATRPLDQLVKTMSWVYKVPPWLTRFTGVAEVVGAVGLILPLATGVLPWLTIAAAAGFVIVQIGALILHVSLGEAQKTPTNFVFLLLAIFIIIGRVALVPIA